MAERGEPQDLEQARAARIADLSVYLALMQFERRQPYRHLEPGLQRDITALFGGYSAAQGAGLALLFQVVDTQAIADACQAAAEHGLGWLIPGSPCNSTPAWSNSFRPCCGSLSAARRCFMAIIATPIWSRSISAPARSA